MSDPHPAQLPVLPEEIGPEVDRVPAQNDQGERLRERTEPMAPDDDQRGYAHALLCGALSQLFNRVGPVFDPPEDELPGAPLLQVENCPAWALPWLAQLVGVRLPAGISVQRQRDLIAEVRGWQRGTLAAMEAGARAWLTGTKTLWLRERDGSAYRLEVITIASETPDSDAVLASILRQKPAGIVLSYRTVEAWDYEQQTSEYPGAYTTLSAAFASYYALTNKEAH